MKALVCPSCGDVPAQLLFVAQLHLPETERIWYKSIGGSYGNFCQVAGSNLPAIFYSEGIMGELSIFCDESGGEGGHSKYCLITLVFHNQSESIDKNVEDYRGVLSNHGLADVPLHTTPLMRGNEQYASMELADRKKLLMYFFIFQRELPYRYYTFAYKRSEVRETAKFTARLRKDLVVFLEDNLKFFQSFDKVKIYYDGGQSMVTKALHDAFDYELSKEAVLYRDAKPSDYRLYQVADFICALELVAIKFDRHELTATDEKFFGLSERDFKKLYLRHVRKKCL